eukprot:2268658-Prymnesium_polylepis.1
MAQAAIYAAQRCRQDDGDIFGGRSLKRQQTSAMVSIRKAGSLQAALAAHEARLTSIFELWDTDGDGLDANEFKRAVRMLRLRPTQEELDEFIRKADTDNSGRLDIDELKVLIGATSKDEVLEFEQSQGAA